MSSHSTFSQPGTNGSATEEERSTASAPPRRGLGRGLGALITSSEEEAARRRASAAAELPDGVRQLAPDEIAPNPHQPRTQFNEQALHELADSIREHGIIQPLIVTRAGEATALASESEARFWLIAGERRWRAARLAGLRSVPALVREASPQQLVEWALVENVQRADLNPLEEASAYQALVSEFGFTQAEVAQRVGKSRSAVTNTMRLLRLPAGVQQALLDQQISGGHARALLGLPKEELMSAALDEILARELNVRQTEVLVKRMVELSGRPQAADEAEEPDPLQTHFAQVEDRFRAALGTRVNLNRNKNGSGRLVVHFYNDDDLEMLYRLMTGDEQGAE